MGTQIKELAGLLQKRLEIIRDQDLRINHPDQQLKQLQEVSEAITTLQNNWQGPIPPRLRHFLENCSYEKALTWIQEQLGEA
jgi:hypothetical protein